MVNFNFQHFFEEEQELIEEHEETKGQITYQEWPSLTFLGKTKMPQNKPIIDETTLSLSPDVKQFFKPTIEEKQKIIEDFLMWAHEKELSADNSGTMIMYIRELKKR